MKKIIALTHCLALSVILLIGCAPRDNMQIKIGVMSGPTGMGMAKLMNDNTESADKYSFEVYNAPTNATQDLLNGSLDMLCLPTNTAANLASKSGGAISVIAINCLGSLYLMTDKNTTVNSISDLDGKTIYASVPSSTTGPIINYILKMNNVNAEIIFEADHDALVAKVVKGETPIVILPEPKATAALSKAEGYSIDLNLSTEWDKISDKPLTMGCIVVRTAFLSEHKGAVDRFLDEYEDSIEYIGNKKNSENAAEMIYNAGVLPSAQIAKAALNNLYGSIVYIDGDDMQEALVGFYTAIELTQPSDDFYYDD